MIDKFRFFVNRLALVIIMLVVSNALHAQITVPSFSSDTNYFNSIGIGPSYGRMLDRNADFWGVSIGYSRKINAQWAATASLAYDQETPFFKGGGNIVNTFTGIFTASYFVDKHWGLTTGLAKGVTDDDNRDKQMKFVDGDWSTGLSLSYNLPDYPYWSRDAFTVSTSLEYNLTQQEYSWSIDFVMGISW